MPVTGSGGPIFLPMVQSQQSGSSNPSPVSTPAPTQPPASGGTQTLLVAGDNVDCGSGGGKLVSDMLVNLPGTLQLAGDTVWGNGSASNYTNCYAPTYGRLKDRTHPAVGNHEYNTSGASAYQAYFGAAAGPAGKFYYSYELGSLAHHRAQHQLRPGRRLPGRLAPGTVAQGGSGRPPGQVHHRGLAPPALLVLQPRQQQLCHPLLAGSVRGRGRAGLQRARPRLRALCPDGPRPASWTRPRASASLWPAPGASPCTASRPSRPIHRRASRACLGWCS